MSLSAPLAFCTSVNGKRPQRQRIYAAGASLAPAGCIHFCLFACATNGTSARPASNVFLCLFSVLPCENGPAYFSLHLTFPLRRPNGEMIYSCLFYSGRCSWRCHIRIKFTANLGESWILTPPRALWNKLQPTLTTSCRIYVTICWIIRPTSEQKVILLLHLALDFWSKFKGAWRRHLILTYKCKSLKLI